MARAAVKAKQQQAKAKAQPSKARARGRRGHSGGGNPNQQLFFMRLRRRQKWVYMALAIIFAATFVGVGVGSGSGAGLDQLYSGIFGGSGDQVSKAKDEIKKNHPNGYLDLARAYEAKGDQTQAVSALQSYLVKKPKDANVWQELGGLQMSQAQTLATQYQGAQQEASLADPSAVFQPTGALATATGSNPAFSTAAQAATTQSSTLYSQATTALTSAVADYKKAKNLQPKSPTALQLYATAAQNAGKYPEAIAAWKQFIKLDPSSPQVSGIRSQIKKLKQAQAASQAATQAQTQPKVSSGG
jgi:tetratricopeptide (TPR) repeat protein